MIKKLKILAILPFLAIMTSVKAYDLTGIPKATRIDYGLYYDTTLVTSPLPSCTSSNEYDCYITDVSLPNPSNTYNNFRIVVRDDMDTNFAIGTQYKISMYFEQETAGYWFSSARITQVTGNTYRNFTNWTTDDITIISYNLTLLDSEDGMYRFDVVFIPSTTQVAGFNFRIWQDYETVSNNNNNYIRMWRNVGISQLTPGQIDYTQNLDDINTSIGGLSDDISDSTQDIIDNQNQNAQDIQNTINDNLQSCRDSNNLFNYANTNYVQNDPVTITGTGNNFTISSSSQYGVRAFSIGKIDFSTLYRYMSSNYSHGSIGLVVTNGNTYSSWSSYTSDRTVLTNNWSSSSYNLSNYQGKYLWIQLRGSYVDSGYSNVTYTDFVLSKVSVSSYEPYGEQICINKLDEQNNAINNINDSLTDETPPDLSALQNSAGWLPPGPVDSILNLPLALFNNLNTNLSKTCQPVTVALPLVSSNISLPCISTVYAQMPNLANFLNWIGYLAAGIILYKYFLHLYKWVDNTLTFRENNWLDNWGGD